MSTEDRGKDKRNKTKKSGPRTDTNAGPSGKKGEMVGEGGRSVHGHQSRLSKPTWKKKKKKAAIASRLLAKTGANRPMGVGPC